MRRAVRRDGRGRRAVTSEGWIGHASLAAMIPPSPRLDRWVTRLGAGLLVLVGALLAVLAVQGLANVTAGFTNTSASGAPFTAASDLPPVRDHDVVGAGRPGRAELEPGRRRDGLPGPVADQRERAVDVDQLDVRGDLGHGERADQQHHLRVPAGHRRPHGDQRLVRERARDAPPVGAAQRRRVQQLRRHRVGARLLLGQERRRARSATGPSASTASRPSLWTPPPA